VQGKEEKHAFSCYLISIDHLKAMFWMCFFARKCERSLGRVGKVERKNECLSCSKRVNAL